MRVNSHCSNSLILCTTHPLKSQKHDPQNVVSKHIKLCHHLFLGQRCLVSEENNKRLAHGATALKIVYISQIKFI